MSHAVIAAADRTLQAISARTARGTGARRPLSMPGGRQHGKRRHHKQEMTDGVVERRAKDHRSRRWGRERRKPRTQARCSILDYEPATFDSRRSSARPSPSCDWAVGDRASLARRPKIDGSQGTVVARQRMPRLPRPAPRSTFRATGMRTMSAGTPWAAFVQARAAQRTTSSR